MARVISPSKPDPKLVLVRVDALQFNQEGGIFLSGRERRPALRGKRGKSQKYSREGEENARKSKGIFPPTGKYRQTIGPKHTAPRCFNWRPEECKLKVEKAAKSTKTKGWSDEVAPRLVRVAGRVRELAGQTPTSMNNG